MGDNSFVEEELERLFNNIRGKTLGEVDTANVFARTITNPKITGIAGDVIEQSVLGLAPNTKQEADFLVDGIETELKTTGLKRSKTAGQAFDAKEPMTITAVSPEKIVNEDDFEDSTLWHKLQRIKLLYYHYDSDVTVPAAEYARFPIQDHHYLEFSEDDISTLASDWKVVRDFIRDVQRSNKDIAVEYPKISKLRTQMLYMDTAPKWPNPPRFRLRRAFVDTKVKQHFGENFIPLKAGNKFSSSDELDNILHEFKSKFGGKTIREIANHLGIQFSDNNQRLNKAVGEQITLSAFGVKSGKLRQIDSFAKMGVIPKTLVLTKTGKRTEDLKFDNVDFDELAMPKLKFEDSAVYNFFTEATFLFIIFQEPHSGSKLDENIFLGFKRLSFDDTFIENHLRATWDSLRDIVLNHKFVTFPKLDKFGKKRVNSVTGTVMEGNNFPKSKDFVRNLTP